MARILVLTPQLPYPPQQGTSLRNFHVLRALAQTNQVTLLSFAEADRPWELEPLQGICRVLPPIVIPSRSGVNRLKSLLTSPEPDLALRLQSDDFESGLITALRKDSYDAVQIEGIELARYIRCVRAVASDTKIVLDCHNAETELQRRSLRADYSRPARWPAALYSTIQIGRLSWFERWAVNESDATITVSETDRAHLLDLGVRRDVTISVIPNTIDISEYDYPSPVPEEMRFDILFTGKMDYRPNIDGVLWFADEIWPHIRHARPRTTWAIVGQRPHPRLNRLREIDGITITGHVPAVQPYLKGCQVYIAPLRIGSGTRLKLVEAMAAGKPVVSTSIGAEGFPVRHGENILLADDPAAWVQAILELLESDDRRAALGEAAREFAGRYHWRGIIASLDSLYAGLIKEE